MGLRRDVNYAYEAHRNNPALILVNCFLHKFRLYVLWSAVCCQRIRYWFAANFQVVVDVL